MSIPPHDQKPSGSRRPFAWEKGEGDRTRNWWLDAHRRYFARQASRERFEVDDDILTVFERFEVVWPLAVADTIRGTVSLDAMTERRRLSNQ
jgi:hypothetical protein